MAGNNDPFRGLNFAILVAESMVLYLLVWKDNLQLQLQMGIVL